MPISEKLAEEILTIVGFHLVAVIFLAGLTVYIRSKSKKSPLVDGYTLVSSSLLIWMISKILKTISPTIEIRWFFIVTQYIGINFLGLSMIVFAYAYIKDRYLTRRSLVLLSVPPLLSMLVIATNPMHHLFYSYFDFYKDRFGQLFYLLQAIQYFYWIVGIVILARGFTKQPIFRGRRGWANLFSTVTLIPIFANLYYILFKVSDVPWIFPFRVFDITPIFGTLALILFTIPALKHRFFDISPFSYSQLLQKLDQGLAIFDTKEIKYCNHYVEKHFSDIDKNRLLQFLNTSDRDILSIYQKDNQYFQIKKLTLPQKIKKRHRGIFQYDMVWISNITQQTLLVDEQNKISATLKSAQEALKVMETEIDAIARARAQSQVAQNVHDILGHSLTLAIGTSELAAVQSDTFAHKEKLILIQEILHRGLAELRSSLTESGKNWQQTPLSNALKRLKSDSLSIDVITQGMPRELSSELSECLFRLCQEATTNAIKHGKASHLDIILRFTYDGITLFAIDNGIGCEVIKESMGLLGISQRLSALGGTFNYHSNGDSGFTLRAFIPHAQ